MNLEFYIGIFFVENIEEYAMIPLVTQKETGFSL
jgi:hypothetical protein